MADYAFATLWQVPAPVAPIWTAITEVERWPQRWRGVAAVVPLCAPLVIDAEHLAQSIDCAVGDSRFTN
jgi:hypothetical protein